ncbi:MAG: tryptophan 7-halogenase [Minicystis sp.]
MRGQNQFDVAILGTGIAGTTLGAILARNGVRTLLIEHGTHPRFAIGESTVPETTFAFRLLAYRYGVPEIANLSSHQRVRRHIGPTSGVKRNFSFVHHREGEEPRPQETNQVATLSPPLGPDVHLYRQDVDAYMLSVAASYGAVVRQRTDITDVAIDGSGVRLRSRQGETFEAQYVVDAGGIKSLLAQVFGLREDPPPMRTCSRSIYTHMLGVLPFDACMAGKEEHGLPSPLSQGTLHHLFDGGWMWVIPFYNHRSSTNRLCSIGLNLDPRRHPKTEMSPEQELRTFIRQFPAIERQFERASSFREWVSSDRSQFSSTRAVGDRYCLIPHAFAFVDPLFSSGLGIAMGAINMIAHRLIQAGKDGDYSAARFAPVEAQVRANFKHFDRLVDCAYFTFAHYPLWNAFYRVWMLGSIYGSSGQLELMGRYFATRDPAVFSASEDLPYAGIQCSGLPEYRALFGSACAEVEAVRDGLRSVDEAAARIHRLLDESGMWMPVLGARSIPELRHSGVWTLNRVASFTLWAQRESPDFVRRAFLKSLRTGDVLKLVAKEWAAELEASGGSIALMARDFVTGSNRDWERLV